MDLFDSLTYAEKQQAIQMIPYFSPLSRGHGSTHGAIRDGVTPGHEDDIIGHRCNSKCNGKGSKGHEQSRAEQAARFVISRR